MLLIVTSATRGDGLLFSYEGDVLPGDPGTGLDVGNPCQPDCSRRLEDGHFILEWGEMGDYVLYSKTVAVPPTPAPDSLWVEWRFRSNQPKPPTDSDCDGRVQFQYNGIIELIFTLQDAVVDFEGGDFVFGLDPDIFHTYRFESLDGTNYTVAVDGVVFNVDFDTGSGNGYHFVQFGGIGDCVAGPERPVPVRNEWDFVRYGTIGSGEQLTAADPPAGNLTPAQGAQLQSFVITFDQPAYLYVDDIGVSVTGGIAPTIAATRRPDNAPPEVLEVFIDGTLPAGETTTFSFDTGSGPQAIAYFRDQPDVPATSFWALLTTALLALLVGAVMFARRGIRT